MTLALEMIETLNPLIIIQIKQRAATFTFPFRPETATFASSFTFAPKVRATFDKATDTTRRPSGVPAEAAVVEFLLIIQPLLAFLGGVALKVLPVNFFLAIVR